MSLPGMRGLLYLIILLSYILYIIYHITKGIFKPVLVSARHQRVVPELEALDADEVEGNLVSKLLYVLGSVFQVSIFMKTFYG